MTQPKASTVEDLLQDNERFQKDYTVFTFKFNGVPVKFVALKDAEKAISDLEATVRAAERERAEIAIGEEQNLGKDEAWCEWFKCPKCKDTMITRDTKYCPNCGIKLKWISKSLSQGTDAK